MRRLDLAALPLAFVCLSLGCGRSPLGPAEADGGAEATPDDGEVDDGEVDDGEVDDSSDDRCDIHDHSRDCDGDGIPDADDPFPEDPGRPGIARSDVIYTHSDVTLSTFELAGGPYVQALGDFTYPDGNGGQVVDIAIDRFGVLYAISGAVLHACHPDTVECWPLGDLDSNSLAFVPLGSVEADDDTLVTLAGSTWTHVLLRGPQMEVVEVADVGEWSSSGDIATTRSGITAFTSPYDGQGDMVVSIEPATGEVLGWIEQPPTSASVWGMAAQGDTLWLFDQGGGISSLDLVDGTASAYEIGLGAWWGAASHPSYGS